MGTCDNFGKSVSGEEHSHTMNCVYGKIIYTGLSVIEESYLIFDGQKVAGIAKRGKGMLLGKFDVITPAFIDPHSHIGMQRAGEPAGEAEANEHADTILALSDALDSVQMDDTAFRDAVEMGVLYSCIVPGSGNIIGGKSAVIRNYAENTTDAFFARAGVKAAFGYNPMSTREWKGTRPSTRMGALALLRGKLDEVRQKVERYTAAPDKKKKEIVFAAEETLLREILAGTVCLRVHVHKIDDIAALLRIVDEFRLTIVVEHAMDVHKPEIFRELARRGISVTYGPVDAFAYKVELRHATWRNICHLIESGVTFGLMSDHPVTQSCNLFLQARWFIRAGYSKRDVVELFCRKNAAILGIDDRLGTLEKGKWASFTCWTGDPFDLAQFPLAVYGEGRLLHSEV